MRLRALGLVVLPVIVLITAPIAARAQQPVRTARIGLLLPVSASDPLSISILTAFRQGMRDVGYVEGQSLVIEPRWAEGKYDRLAPLAAELVQSNVDVIVTYTAPAIRAAKQATSTIPIVMAGVIDPVSPGFVASLARPGGNVTGLSIMAPELVGKQLEILRELVPNATRLGVLGNPDNPGYAPQFHRAQQAGRALKVELRSFEARGPGDVTPAFAAMTKEGIGALIVLVDIMLETHRTRVVELAARHRLPAVYGLRDYVNAGGLLSYGASGLNFRAAALYVDKILKGAKPGDLPVEQPTKFELVINLKTAKALGLTIPPSVLLRADAVIE
jgi:putative tryptophan/tyrosine transport system substrate-binding protein